MLPTLTPEQREQALRKATEARQATSQARAALKSGTITFADVLDGSVPALHKAKVRSLLTLLPGIGTVRADKLMATAGIDSRRRVNGLGPVQRATLRDELGLE